MEEEKSITEVQNWKRKVIVIGALAGALIGLAGAFLFIQRVDDPDHLPDMTAGDGVRLGILVMGLLRSVAELAEG